ncbi:MAG: pyruvate dehydrogenase complex dihydrolipoamide acetyltransferase [Bacteroidota bacterium]
MAEKIEMPKLSDTMEEGVIAKWNVQEGDTVSAGDIIAEVETDKATMDVEVFDGGTILKIIPQEGDAVPLGGLIAIIGEEGEDISGLLDGAGSGSSEPKAEDAAEAPAEEAKAEEAAAPAVAEEPVAESDGRIKASPLAKKIAQENGINLAGVQGSGPEGRIVKKDVEGAPATPASAPAAEQPAAPAFTPRVFESLESKEIKVSQMRKVIARRLSESKFTSPHFYETIDIDMKAAMAARSALNAANPDIKISFNDIVVKAAAIALTRHQAINSSWHGDTIAQHGDVNVAFAVAIDEGLMTPVINHADKKGLAEISAETRELAGLSRDRKLQPEQMEGSTFTISNLGMFGIEEFTAIINPPNACIMAVGAIRDVPVVEDGAVVPGKRMKVTLSSDHRVVDGAKAAAFLQTFRSLMQNPLEMLL